MRKSLTALRDIIDTFPSVVDIRTIITTCNMACGLGHSDIPDPVTCYSWTEILHALQEAGYYGDMRGKWRKVNM